MGLNQRISNIPIIRGRGYSAIQDPFKTALRNAVESLEAVNLDDALQAHIVSELLDGRRTIPELVEAIYQVSRGSNEFDAYYMRIRRSIRRLENRGFVSTTIFGRDRPYRLTKYAVQSLAGIPMAEREVLFPRSHVITYLVTLVTAIASGLSVIGLILPRSSLPYLFGTCLFFMGASSWTLIDFLRRVW